MIQPFDSNQHQPTFLAEESEFVESNPRVKSQSLPQPPTYSMPLFSNSTSLLGESTRHCTGQYGHTYISLREVNIPAKVEHHTNKIS